MVNREVASSFSDRSTWGDPQILHPALHHERAPYHTVPVSETHARLTLKGQHVADARRSAAGGWDLFAVDHPALAIGWAGNLAAMRLLASEALPAQMTAQPGCYVWCVLALGKVAAYQRPAPLAEVA